MNVEKIRKSIIIKFIIFGSLAVLLATIVSNMNHSFIGLFTHDMNHTVEMVRTDDDNAVVFKDLLKLKNEAEFDKVSGYSEIISGVSNKFGVSKRDIKAVLIDAEYISIYKNEMLVGSFPDTQAMEKGESYTVISEQLAVNLFKSLDIIGNEIEVLGQKYTVVGVYKSKSSILWSLCGDGFDRLFVPYSSIDNYKDKSVDVIALLEKPEQSKDDVKILLETVLGSKMSSYEIIEHSISSIVFHQYFGLLIFVIGVLAILFTLIFFIKYSINTIRYLKKKADSYYISKIFKGEVRRVVCYLFVFLLCGVCIILLMKCIQFKFFIADRYIPDNNIFDVQFYIKVFINDIVTSNSHTSNVYSVCEYNYKNVFQLVLFCTFMFMIFFIVAHMFFNLLLVFDMNFSSILKLVIVIIIVGGAIGICTSTFLGLRAFLPFKTWMLMLYFLIILLCIRMMDKYKFST